MQIRIRRNYSSSLLRVERNLSSVEREGRNGKLCFISLFHCIDLSEVLSFAFLLACSLDFQAAQTHSGSTAGFGVCEYVVCGYVFAAGSDVELRLGIYD